VHAPFTCLLVRRRLEGDLNLFKLTNNTVEKIGRYYSWDLIAATGSSLWIAVSALAAGSLLLFVFRSGAQSELVSLIRRAGSVAGSCLSVCGASRRSDRHRFASPLAPLPNPRRFVLLATVLDSIMSGAGTRGGHDKDDDDDDDTIHGR
jgi:hypothetical protein